MSYIGFKTKNNIVKLRGHAFIIKEEYDGIQRRMFVSHGDDHLGTIYTNSSEKTVWCTTTTGLSKKDVTSKFGPTKPALFTELRNWIIDQFPSIFNEEDIARMKHDKSHYKALELPDGFKWVYFESETGLHAFQSGNYQTGFQLLRCNESEIDDGSLMLMIKNGWTR